MAESFFYSGKSGKDTKKPAEHILDAFQKHIRECGLESVVEIDPLSIIKTVEGQRLNAEDFGIIVVVLGAAGITSDRELARAACPKIELPEHHNRKVQIPNTIKAYHQQVRERVTAAVPNDYWNGYDLSEAWDKLTEAETAINGTQDMSSFEFAPKGADPSNIAARTVIFLGLAKDTTEAGAMIDPLKNKFNRIGSDKMRKHFFNEVLWYQTYGFWQIDQQRYGKEKKLKFSDFLNENMQEIAEDLTNMDRHNELGDEASEGPGIGGRDYYSGRRPSASGKLNQPYDLKIGTVNELDPVHHRKLTKRVSAIRAEKDGHTVYWFVHENTGYVEPPICKELCTPTAMVPPGVCYWYHGEHAGKTKVGCRNGKDCKHQHAIDLQKPTNDYDVVKVKWGEVIESQKDLRNHLAQKGRRGKHGRSNKGSQGPGNPWKDDDEEDEDDFHKSNWWKSGGSQRKVQPTWNTTYDTNWRQKDSGRSGAGRGGSDSNWKPTPGGASSGSGANRHPLGRGNGPLRGNGDANRARSRTRGRSRDRSNGRGRRR